MASATIPVDLLNPGQVFACLGIMEAAEILCGPCEGGFSYDDDETSATFTATVDGPSDPVASALRFLASAKAQALVPRGSKLSTDKWKAEAISIDDGTFPCPEPDSPAALPIILTNGDVTIPVDHWSDGGASGRDNVKFWAGAAGYPGVALARDALAIVQALGHNALASATADPFAVSAPQTSSFRFDWRRDYIPRDVGFSPNVHGSMQMVGYPLVELLAAIGLQHARPDRPDRRDKLAYRYGVSSAVLPTALARAVLGTQTLGFPARIFRMTLGWPGQEDQARCIIDAQEEPKP